MTADVPETSSGRSVRVVLVADPGLPSEIARALAPGCPTLSAGQSVLGADGRSTR
ncbi:hypothetical protein [Streptomyces sp. TP-A0356]|uniref:hypothetical protein n=1 Tax=Streptomyces sp. TP-A0356 TaxID=1359208 RepID=UPI00131C791F|nr:hypothetical protein [Streptomyces sp. TP-A0356]